MKHNIKTINYKDSDAGKQFTSSLHDSGFAIIRNHSLDFQLIESVYDEWKSFFNTEDKFNYTFDIEKQDGYFPYRSENAKGFNEKDLKEFFHFYEWGVYPKDISKRTVMLFHQLLAIGRELLVWIDANTPFEIKSKFSIPLYNMIEGSKMNLLRVIHYPPIEDNPGEAIRAEAHADINLITVLASGSEPGLQVLNNDEWIDIECNPGWLIINIGDMLQECSNGYFPSTIHRVVNPKGDGMSKSRFSIPLFIHPRDEVILSKNYTAKSFLDERLLEIGLK